MPTTRSQTSRRMESNGGAHSLDASITEDESDDEIDQHQPPAKGIKNRKATPRTEKEERFPNYPRPDKSEIPPLSSPVDNVQQGKTSTPSGGPYGLGYLSIFLSWRVVFVCVVCGLSWLFAQYSQRNVKVKFSDLKTLFSSQDPEMWDHLRAGLMPDKVGGVQNFLFLHSSPRTVDCFLKTLTQNDCYTFKAREIVNSGPFVESFKDKLLDYKCLVVFDLEDLHPDGVVVLKGFCDPHDPIVPNSKFYFALNAGPDMDADAYKLARNLLETKWLKNLTHDDFGGTLTRLTQNVLKIRDEPKLPC